MEGTSQARKVPFLSSVQPRDCGAEFWITSETLLASLGQTKTGGSLTAPSSVGSVYAASPTRFLSVAIFVTTPELPAQLNQNNAEWKEELDFGVLKVCATAPTSG